jgi:acyl carrier protein
MDDKDLENTIRRVTLEIARRKVPQLADVQMEHSLVEWLGLGSMDLAELIAILEMELGVDPFATTSISRIRTVGDIYEAYRAAGA